MSSHLFQLTNLFVSDGIVLSPFTYRRRACYLRCHFAERVSCQARQMASADGPSAQDDDRLNQDLGSSRVHARLLPVRRVVERLAQQIRESRVICSCNIVGVRSASSVKNQPFGVNVESSNTIVARRLKAEGLGTN